VLLSGSGLDNEGVGDDGFASGFRSSHLVHPLVAPHDDNIPCANR
jgi:hypothetical protein